jgi:hypothetical protein
MFRRLFLLAVLAFSGAAQAGELLLDINGRSWHASRPQAYPAHDWNENNQGLGLQFRTDVFEGARYRYFAGTMRDSLGVDGEYVGHGYEWVFDRGPMRYSAGGALMLMNRTLNFGEKKSLYVFPLPVASVEYRPWGVGLNAVFIPGFDLGKKEMPTTLFINLSLKLANF